MTVSVYCCLTEELSCEYVAAVVVPLRIALFHFGGRFSVELTSPAPNHTISIILFYARRSYGLIYCDLERDWVYMPYVALFD